MTTSTQFKTLPSIRVRVIAEVFSDKEIGYQGGFFRGIVGNKAPFWSVMGPIGKTGLKIVSDWMEVSGTTSIEEAFSKMNPGFYPGNCNFSYDFGQM